jgi:hypothetical protein
MLTVDEAQGLAKRIIPSYDKLDEGERSAYTLAAGLCEKETILKKVYEVAQKKFRLNIFRKKDASHPEIIWDVLYFSTLTNLSLSLEST